MLTLLPEESLISDFDQCLEIDKEKILRLITSVTVAPPAFSRGGRRHLVLYRRHNWVGRQEAGIIYGSGPKQSLLLCPWQMLRFFSKDKDGCYNLAEKIYIDLTEEYDFRCL